MRLSPRGNPPEETPGLMGGAVARALDMLFPAGCVSCRTWIPRSEARDGAPICARCRSRLRMASWPRCARCHAPLGTGLARLNNAETPDCHECRPWSPQLSTARSAFLLAAPASDLVHALKYEGWSELAGFMAWRMAAVVRESANRASADGVQPGGVWDAQRVVVMPMPTTPTRERRRGYNQAGLLAAGVASELGLPLKSLLIRTLDRRSQIKLEPRERRANVRGVFAPHPAMGGLSGTSVVLVDDVLTTGATASEAAALLIEQGASSVHLATFARALPEPFSSLS